MGATNTVTSDIRGGVCCITMNRPERFNAINAEMDIALREAFIAATLNRECKAIVLTGAGMGFCSGADLDATGTQSPAWDPIPTSADRFRFAYLRQCPKPTIAAINGAAVGVGLVLACLCDIRIASLNAKLAFPYAQLGLVAEYGIASRLAKLIGMAKSTELLITGRRFSVPEAQAMGLVSQAVDGAALEQVVQALAESLAASNSPYAMAAIKRQLNAVSDRNFLEAVAMAGEELANARLSHDYSEAKLARAEKRKPRFTGD